jgi:hypothetical protein
VRFIAQQHDFLFAVLMLAADSAQADMHCLLCAVHTMNVMYNNSLSGYSAYCNHYRA